MAATALNRLGQANNTGSAEALFETRMSGLVLHAYEKRRRFKDAITKRGFPKGLKGFTVKLHGQGSAKYHTAGQNIIEDGSYLTQFRQAEQTILVNDELLDATMIPDIDAFKSNYDEMKAVAFELGRGLADKDDEYCYRAIIAASRRNISGNDKYTGEPTTSLTTDGAKTTTLSGGLTRTQKADALVTTIYEVKETFDALDVDPENRFLALHPSYATLLFNATSKEFLNKDWGGNGSVASGNLPMAAGFRVVVSSNAISADRSSDTAKQTELNINLANYIGCFWTPEAAVRAGAKELKFETEYKTEYRGTLAVAATLTAYGSLRRECAIGWKQN